MNNNEAQQKTEVRQKIRENPTKGFMDHRKYNRFNKTFTITVFDSQKRRHFLDVINISGGGLGIVMKSVIFPIGTILTVHIQWDRSIHPVIAEAQVRWVKTSKTSASCNGGLEFTKIKDIDRNLIIKYINSQQQSIKR